eukprot:gnl/MRDRNA2_/MRDRNA2_26072_c0_seq1.p1 gnl/MRDRNA2_/MRDRNA2_26072_c0~~gnl/MRDRNA2_/MRDRNA2_26072_c0_seq1.p1  ORF type:complete len:238 (-),score=42.77 gnl/MRDRNA2_/MRDRNA2_26072_c0_seq1:20-733(-)
MTWQTKESTRKRRSKRKSEAAAISDQLEHENELDGMLAQTLGALPVDASLPVVVSQLEKAHIPFVQRLHENSLPVQYSERYFLSALQSAPWAKVALWNGCVVGCALCKVSEELLGTIHIRTVISKVVRRKIASQLLRAVFVEASELGFSKSSLYVHVKNEAAIAFYASLGYKVKETRVNFYRSCPEKLEAPPDAFLMVCDLGVSRTGSASQEGCCGVDTKVSVDDLPVDNTSSSINP